MVVFHRAAIAGRQTRLGGVGRCKMCGMMRVRATLQEDQIAAIHGLCMAALQAWSTGCVVKGCFL